MAQPGNKPWDPTEDDDEYFDSLTLEGANPSKLSTDQVLYLDQLATLIENPKYTNGVARWLSQPGCGKVYAAFNQVCRKKVSGPAENALRNAENEAQERRDATSRRLKPSETSRSLTRQRRTQPPGEAISGVSGIAATQTQRTRPAEDDKGAQPSTAQAAWGKVRAGAVAGLAEDKKRKLFADIEKKLARQRDLKAIDAFLAEPTVGAEWEKYLQVTRPAHKLTTKQFLDLPPEDRLAVFKQMNLDLRARRLAKLWRVFSDTSSSNPEFRNQWEHFLKAGTIIDGGGIDVENELWAALGYKDRQGPFATDGMKKAGEDKNLMRAVMVRLHDLRKADESKVVPWLRANENVDKAFDKYLRNHTKPRSNSNTDGTTRGAASSEFSDKWQAHLDESVRKGKTHIQELGSVKTAELTRSEADKHRRVATKVGRAVLVREFALKAKLNPHFIAEYLRVPRPIESLSTKDRIGVVRGLGRMLLEAPSDQVERELQDVLVVDTVMPENDRLVRRKQLRIDLQNWVHKNVDDVQEKNRLLDLIAQAGAKGSYKRPR